MKDFIRLDKYLAEMGEGTRSEIKEMARKGRIAVNGSVEKKTDRKVCPSEDTVTVDGRTVAYAAYEYYMLHKPQGVVSATEDKTYTTVVELIDERKRKDLFPVGRLDIDTEGLLILTNDGELAHRLLAPKSHVDKVYYARVAGELPENAKELVKAGLTLTDGTVTLPARLEIGEEIDGADGPLTEVLLTIREGKFHQVKRMFESMGCRVVYLKRLSMGGLKLDESLKPGEYRPLTEKEVDSLRKASQERNRC